MVSRRVMRRTDLCPDMRTKPENTFLVDAELAKGRFSFIYREIIPLEVKVKKCIRLFTSRKICQPAIRGLRKALDVDESGHIGYSYAGGLKVVVEIPENKLHIVKRYLLNKGKSEEEAAEEAFNRGIEWYGIVDGRITHQSLSELEVSRPDPFQDFKWIVTLIKWQPIWLLKAFSRARNLLQKDQIVEMTVFDKIQGLHEIALEKAQVAGESVESYRKQRGIITKIADEFCGGSRYARQATRTLAGVALRIKPEALKVFGQIMNEENPSLVKRMLARTNSEVVSENDIFDATAFEGFISTNTVRAAITLLNAHGRGQAHVLLRLKSSFEETASRVFKPRG